VSSGDGIPSPMSAAVPDAGPPASRTVRIGLTGAIGCGKSTVASWLGELGAGVIDADQVAREVVEPGTDAFAAVVREFGTSVLLPSGALDRPALGRIVFSDPDALARLERIIHPAVRPWILEAIAAAELARAPAVVIEAIKLVEGGLAELCDEVWLVVCDPAAQRDRLTSRGLPAADAEARMATQADLASRLAPFATRVIDTSGSLPRTREVVVAAWRLATNLPDEDAAPRMPADR
jgi:dephospho-CoA kinase